MVNDCDKFFNCHIDSLEFLNFNDIDWHKHFYTIPEPTIRPINKWGKFICLQLVSGSSQTHRLNQWYIDRLVTDISKKFPQYGIFLISTPETNHFYEKLVPLLSNVSIFNGSLKEVCDVVLCSSAFCGVDSAWRLLSYSQNKPTITLSKDCQGYGNVPISHKLRWLLWPNTTFGLNFSTSDIVNLFSNMMQDKKYLLFPELTFMDKNAIIKREYKVNLEKSIILNG